VLGRRVGPHDGVKQTILLCARRLAKQPADLAEANAGQNRADLENQVQIRVSLDPYVGSLAVAVPNTRVSPASLVIVMSISTVPSSSSMSVTTPVMVCG